MFGFWWDWLEGMLFELTAFVSLRGVIFSAEFKHHTCVKIYWAP